jgi:hypothetical protein
LGQPYFNGQVGRLELYTDTGWQNIVQETPGVASATGTYNQSAGSGTFTISGTNFVDGAIAYAVGTNATEYQATTTTYNSLVQLTAVFSNLSPAYEPYDVKVVNPSNLFGFLPDAFFINDSPVWSTTAGSLGNYTGSSIQLAATDDESSTITYSVTSGSLPTGLSLSSAGLISGTATTEGTYTFTVSASDGVNTAVTRSFSLVVPVSVTGGNIAISGDYRIHSFTSTGTFSTNLSSLSVDYLIVAGGGSGAGYYYAGGGGAGGLLSGTTSLSASSNSVIVGAGGAEVNPNTSSLPGNSGSNSSAFSVTSFGGGAGGAQNTNGSSGGSGGGGGGNQTSTRYGGEGTSGQGNTGGTTSNASTAVGQYGAGAGGGGAGGVGGNVSGNYSVAGAGGLGLANSISGSSTFYAGGGGGGGGSDSTANGGPGGSGIGGDGASTRTSTGATAGSTNTGSGGGGASHNGSYAINAKGAAGGSGVVIVRYLKSAVGL